jgi:ribosomal protein L37AE/L43A
MSQSVARGQEAKGSSSVSKTDESAVGPNSSRRSCEASESDAMLCERCGKAEMYRMHAVWRCPECGFKTDCCGW